MRKISEAEARESLRLVAEARSYIQTEMSRPIQAAYYRIVDLENEIRKLLGEPMIDKYECWHICSVHKQRKKSQSSQPIASNDQEKREDADAKSSTTPTAKLPIVSEKNPANSIEERH